ncbi:hypothetical protein AAVH_14537 [Aphelenchoides avenae]|nr:hypothetical protein AAVH_14537 [Aphelenchus avenae]
MSAIGGRVIAESLHNDSTKSDPHLRQLRHKIIRLWDRRARRSSDRKKRDAGLDIKELHKLIEQRFSDVITTKLLPPTN